MIVHQGKQTVVWSFIHTGGYYTTDMVGTLLNEYDTRSDALEELFREGDTSVKRLALMNVHNEFLDYEFVVGGEVYRTDEDCKELIQEI